MNSLIINCDGGSRGNPGPAASAFVASVDGKKIHSDSKYLGVATNNVAEYSAVIIALEWLSSSSLTTNHYSLITFILDSELIVKQIKGLYKVKDEKLKSLHAHVVQLIKKIGKEISFQNVLREKNQIADDLVNKELDNIS